MKLWIALLGICMSGSALAHGPTPQKSDQTVLIKASPDTVWKLLSEPCAIKNWHPDVQDCASATPLTRTLTLKSGGILNEEIDELLPSEMSISYRISGEVDVKALPVSSLTGRIRIKAEGADAQVNWIARYYRADTSNEPPQGFDDETAVKSVNAYVKSGLGGLMNAAK